MYIIAFFLIFIYTHFTFSFFPHINFSQFSVPIILMSIYFAQSHFSIPPLFIHSPYRPISLSPLLTQTTPPILLISLSPELSLPCTYCHHLSPAPYPHFSFLILIPSSFHVIQSSSFHDSFSLFPLLSITSVFFLSIPAPHLLLYTFFRPRVKP